MALLFTTFTLGEQLSGFVHSLRRQEPIPTLAGPFPSNSFCKLKLCKGENSEEPHSPYRLVHINSRDCSDNVPSFHHEAPIMSRQNFNDIHEGACRINQLARRKLPSPGLPRPLTQAGNPHKSPLSSVSLES